MVMLLQLGMLFCVIGVCSAIGWKHILLAKDIGKLRQLTCEVDSKHVTMLIMSYRLWADVFMNCKS